MITTLLKRNSFLFAEAKRMNLNLYKPHFEQYFDRDASKVQQPIKELVKKYHLPKKGVEKIFRNKPQIFIQDSPERAELEGKVQFLNKLSQTEPLAGVLNDFLFESRHLLLSMTIEDITTFIEQLKKIGLSKNQAARVFSISKNLIHRNFDIIYKERYTIFKDYLQLKDEQIVELVTNQPFFLTCSAERLRQSVVFFVEQEGEVLTREKTLQMLNQLGEIFLMGRSELSMLFRWIRGWGFQSKYLWGIFLKHPLLLLNHPGQIFHFKAKMLRQFRFTTIMAKKMLRKYPAALICSVRALESKLLVARDRLKITLDENNIQFLTFKFGSNIRPRTQMLIRGKIPYTSEDVNSYFNCTDEQFIRKTGIPAEKLKEEKQKYPLTSEMDYPSKQCLKYYPSANKIHNLSKRYYPLEYPQTQV